MIPQYMFPTQYNHYQSLCTSHTDQVDTELSILTVIIPINVLLPSPDSNIYPQNGLFTAADEK